MEFLWKLAGADPFILNMSGKESQHKFLVIGVLFVLVNFIIFFSFFGLFFGVFDRFLVGIFGAVLMTFIIGNIYRLTFISLEPQTLPIKQQRGSYIASMTVRISVVSLFALFVSKSIETTLFGHLVHDQVEAHMDSIGSSSSSKFIYEESSLFLERMIQLNKHEPWIWVLTLLIVAFFIAPIFLRANLRKRNEYYSFKRIIDKALVEDHYKVSVSLSEESNSLLKLRYRNLYAEYNDSDIQYAEHLERYLDPPYNTKLKPEGIKHQGTMTDFANLNWD